VFGLMTASYFWNGYPYNKVEIVNYSSVSPAVTEKVTEYNTMRAENKNMAIAFGVLSIVCAVITIMLFMVSSGSKSTSTPKLTSTPKSNNKSEIEMSDMSSTSSSTSSSI